MKYFGVSVFVVGVLLAGYYLLKERSRPSEPYYEIVAFHHEPPSRTVLRRIKPSELESAAGVMPAPQYQLTLNDKPVGKIIKGDDALPVFAASYLRYFFSTDPQGNADGKIRGTVSTVASAPGHLDVILVIDNNGNIVIDKEGNPIWFDAAFESELSLGPLPEPGIKQVYLRVDERGKLVFDASGNPIPCGPSAGNSEQSACNIFTARKTVPSYEITSITEDGKRTLLKTIKAWQLRSAAGPSDIEFDLAAPDGKQDAHTNHLSGDVALNLFFTQIRFKMAAAAKRCANSYPNVILVFDDLRRLVLHKDGGPITFNPETIAQTISSERYDADAFSGSYEVSLVVDSSGALVFDKRGHVIAFDPTATVQGSWNGNTYTVDTTTTNPCGG